jgi:putative transcriptional regulator
LIKLKIENNIRRLRFNADEMTQQQLADKVGVTRQTIIALESKKYSPTLDLAFRIANAFKVSLEEVFFLESNEMEEDVANGIQYKINI